MSVLRRQAHGNEGLCGEGVSLEDSHVEQLPFEVSVFVGIIVDVQVAPTAGQTHARLVGPELPRLADKHVHDGAGGLLARRKRVEIRHVCDIEVLCGEALVRRDGVGRGYAIMDGELCRRRRSGVLDDGAELEESSGCEELNGYSDRRAGH